MSAEIILKGKKDLLIRFLYEHLRDDELEELFMLDETYEMELSYKNLKDNTKIVTKTWKLNVFNTFNKMGLALGTKGREYLEYILQELKTNPDLMETMTIVLYPYVAKYFKTTASKVERNIRVAIERVFLEGNIFFLEEVFGRFYSIERGKVTNLEFIYGVYKYLYFL